MVQSEVAPRSRPIEDVKGDLQPLYAQLMGLHRRFASAFYRENGLGEDDLANITPGELSYVNIISNLEKLGLMSSLQTAFDLTPNSEELKQRILSGEPLANLRPSYKQNLPPESFPDSPLDIMVDEIFKSEQATSFWMQAVDKAVSQRSEQLIEQIDKGDSVVYDFILVGGGPATATASVLANVGYKVLVITQAERLGEPWRSREDLYLNSSGDIEDINNPPFPLGGGGTTVANPPMDIQYVTSQTTVLRGALSVHCEDGSTRNYANGRIFGEGAATNIAFSTANTLVGQTADPSTITSTNNDTQVQFKIVDKDGKVRTVDGKSAIFLTGPGPQNIAKIETGDDFLFNSAKEALTTRIERAMVRLDRLSSRIDALSDAPQFVKQKTRLQQRLARGINRIRLPRALTQESIEDLTRFIQRYERNLPDNSNAFPLSPLFERGFLGRRKKIAIIGGGDTGYGVQRYLRGASEGPYSSRVYAESVRQGKRGARTVIFGKRESPRQRYLEDFEAAMQTPNIYIPQRVTSVRRGLFGLKVYYKDGDREKFQRVSRVFNTAGLDDAETADQLADSTRLDRRFTVEGVRYVRGESVSNIARRRRTSLYNDTYTQTFIAGVAAGIPKRALFQPLEEALNLLVDQDANSLSLWIYAWNCLTLFYSLSSYGKFPVVAKGGERQRELIDLIQQGGLQRNILQA